jgi:hypothetical protein
VTGAVLSAVASLEATINELFIDAQHKDPYTFEGADPEFAPLLAERWKGVERKRWSTLRKYQLVLNLAKKQEFDRDGSPYEEVDSLIDLRNALVHYKPEWDTDQKRHKKIEDRLKRLV